MDVAWERHLAMREEARHHGQCVACGRWGEYGSDMYECEACGVPVHEGACEGEHQMTHDEDEEES